MTKLTKTQVEILASASSRDDGRITRPNHLRPSAAAKAATALIKQGLVREIRAKADTPVWRQDKQGKTFSLVILKAGRTVMQQEKTDEPVALQAHESIEAATTIELSTPRPTSKIGGLLSRLERDGGATTEEMTAATGWLPHTLRAALTGLRKRGYAIERIRRDGQGTTAYRVAPTAAAAV